MCSTGSNDEQREGGRALAEKNPTHPTPHHTRTFPMGLNPAIQAMPACPRPPRRPLPWASCLVAALAPKAED